MPGDETQPLRRSSNKDSELQGQLPSQEQDSTDLSVKVDELLLRSFDDALRLLPALHRHIDSQEDAVDVMEEFRASWHPEAPAELRQVLEELIDPVAAAASAAATEAFMKNPLDAFLIEPAAGVEQEFGTSSHQEKIVPGSWDLEQASQLESSRHVPREHFSEQLDEGAQDEDHPLDPDLGAQVDELLQKTFDEALQDFPALRLYISSQEDALDVEEEFRQSWHREASGALRQVLEELLDPAAAAANAQETATFLGQMASASGSSAGSAAAAPQQTQSMASGLDPLRAKL